MTKKSETKLMDYYLGEHDKYAQKYGKYCTIVFMQVGSFYEVYSVNDLGPDLSKISLLLDIQLTRKDKEKIQISKKNPNLVGVPLNSINKYVKKLMNNGWTVIIIDQITPAPNPKRKVSCIYSPGTCLDSNPDTNNIISIYLSEYDSVLSAGLVSFDFSTGKGMVHEVHSKKNDNQFTLDEIFRYIVSNNPKELILSMDGYDDKKMNKYITYLELEKKVYHIKKHIPKEYSKLSYQNEYLAKVWPAKGTIKPIEQLDMEKMPNSIISLIILLDFSIDHNEKIVQGLPYPEIFQVEHKLILGNNAPMQLNILENNTLEYARYGKKTYKNLLDVIDKTCTAIGKRRIKELILNPYIDSKIIEQRYNYVDELKSNFDFHKNIEISLTEIIDIEKLHRKLLMFQLSPFDFTRLHYSYKSIMTIINDISENKVLSKMNIGELKKELKEYMKTYSNIININEAKKYLLINMRGSFFVESYDNKIDELNEKIINYKNILKNICIVLSKYIMEPDDSDSSDTETQKRYPIKLKSNEKEGRFLQTTKLRSDELKKKIQSKKITVTSKFSLNADDLKYKTRPAGKTVKITFSKLSEIDDELYELEEKIEKLIHKEWINLLKNWANKYKKLYTKLSDFVGEIDILRSSAKTAKEYNYVRPCIKTSEKSYIDVKAMRHPIIERLCTDTEYIPHDVQLGKDIDGILLFGLNSSGKSSIMKAIGLTIIMAQCGMFVSATSLTYSPYVSLYARITGHDNIFKGLSSFSLEMVELKTILKRSNERTLVIGDEICRGTEWISGSSIVASTIDHLATKKTSFIFATHLHMIADLPQIKQLKNVTALHLTVHVNQEGDLIFDRKLQQGSGPNMYGLTVAKHILSDNSFMKKAQMYKNEILQIDTSVKTSKYNKNVFIEKCEICGFQISGFLDVHHINFQSECVNGFSIKKPHIEKNQKYNLVVLCKTCHIEVHSGLIKINGKISTSDGVKLDYKKNTIDVAANNDFEKIKKLKLQFDDCTSQNSFDKAVELLKQDGIHVPKSVIKKIWSL